MAKKRKLSNRYKYTITVIVLVIFIVISIYTILTYYQNLYNSNNNNPNDPNDNNQTIVNFDELQITFLETGNKYTGDAIYIKAGENDILIDAGSRKSSATTITNYLNTAMEDNILEYVIATHAHQDHIAGFVGTKDDGGIFDHFECKTIIDFPLTNATSQIYEDYVVKRTLEIDQGATHYTALECYNNEKGATRIIELGNNIQLEILYNYYYDHKTSNENDYSVCLLIKQGTNNFLFTGDLEAEGEEYLVEYNTLPQVEVYKASHHGSYTAGSTRILDVIKPKIICICCCAGSDEYTDVANNMFPAQAFISRICKYTEQVYVTSLMTNDGFTSMNGNINITSTSTKIVVNCSNNNTILKDTEWFKKNRKWE